jgi:TonB family protein
MTRLYQKPRERQLTLVSIGLGVVMVLLIFLLIPLTQMWQASPKTTNTIEELTVTPSPPPPPPSHPPPPPPPEAEEVKPPELDVPLPMPSLEQLELSLNPGVGGELRIGNGVKLDFEVESIDDLLSRYGFEELDAIPHVTRRGGIQYPVRLQRRKVEGYVQLLIFIDPSGRVDVQEVLDYSHLEFVEPAKAGAAKTRFSSPLRNGQPVSAKYSWRIEFSLGN